MTWNGQEDDRQYRARDIRAEGSEQNCVDRARGRGPLSSEERRATAADRRATGGVGRTPGQER